MDDKLVRFFNAIKLEEEYTKAFENARFEKVVINERAKEWTIYINLVDLINVEVFKLMYEKSKTLENVNKVHFVFSFQNDNGYLKDYYLYYFNILCVSCPMLQSMIDNEVIIDNQNITLTVLNTSEENKVKSLSKNIVTFLKNIGFKDVTFETNIDKELEVQVIKQMENETPKFEQKPKSKVIFGTKTDGEITKICNIYSENANVILEAYIFGIEFKQLSKFILCTLKISDKTDSMYAKIFLRTKEEQKVLEDNLQINGWYKFFGYVAVDNYTNELTYNIRSIEIIEHTEEERTDGAEVKRVELHVHTTMSQMDGLINYKKLLKKVKSFGHRAVAVTDKNSIQMFPKLYKEKEDIKVLFGTELFVIDDEVKISTKDTDESLNGKFVIFDLETTGFNAYGSDSIIEIGAVKIDNGEVIDRFDELINPGVKLRDVIVNLTNITDEMLKDKETEEVVFKRFMEWVGDLPMIAHNAPFDASFVKKCFDKYNLGEFNNTVIDTAELSRSLEPDQKHHNLTSLTKRYNVEWDEEAHHRADYDAEATAKIFIKMVKNMGSNYKTVKDLRNLVDVETMLKTKRSFHITVFAKDNVGLKNLFKIISFANTDYFYKTPRILKSVLTQYREGLLIGSGCASGEVFTKARSVSEEDLINLMNFYDFIEVNPPSILEYLIDTEDFTNMIELKESIKKIVNTASSINKIVVAAGDVHTLNPEDNIYREILIKQKQPGGGLHPLNRKNIYKVPNAYFMTTNEMLNEFEFLGKEKAYEIVVTNTNKVADMIGDVEILKKDLYAPKMENSEQTMKDLVYTTAKNIYGENLPEIIATRLDKELNGIINGGYDVIYLIAQKLVKHSNDNGYIVGSRGSVGSSLVATFMNITEVNPLPPHYVCPNCKKSMFEDENGVPYLNTYGSGFDMPNKICTCGTKMNKNGQNIPFETFLGFNADKTPDIDLNFSGEDQASAHDYTKVLFGEKNVYRAGTVTTIAEKTAYGFVKKYAEEKMINLRKAEIDRLAMGITGIRRTTGQHPGGIIVIPAYMEVFDFTPYQYPAEDTDAKWYTTHFEFHDIEPNVLKLDILGHDDPTVLKYLCDDLKMGINDIPLDDTEVLSIFSSNDALKISKNESRYKVGTLGVPEFGTNFTIQMLEEVMPTTFAELIKISGLSHGTDVWNGNARDLILNKICDFKEVIGCRDDIMLYLIKCGIDKGQSFKMSEFIRKGKVHKEPEKWEEFKQIMKDHEIPSWYIASCEKIKYMFPKAHATAYVTNGFRVAWFKVHHPLNYYRVFLSIRKSDFDIEVMIKGLKDIRSYIREVQNKGFGATDKEKNISDTLEVAEEMILRGFKFDNISIEKSDATMFKINETGDGLIPPFNVLEGLGEVAAKNIVIERDKKPFVSIEDFRDRGKVSETLIDKMKQMGIFNGMPESSQLSLF